MPLSSAIDRALVRSGHAKRLGAACIGVAGAIPKAVGARPPRRADADGTSACHVQGRSPDLMAWERECRAPPAVAQPRAGERMASARGLTRAHSDRSITRPRADAYPAI